MKKNFQPLLSLILSLLSDLSQVADMHTERGQLRDFRFYYLLLTIGAAVILMVVEALLFGLGIPVAQNQQTRWRGPLLSSEATLTLFYRKMDWTNCNEDNKDLHR